MSTKLGRSAPRATAAPSRNDRARGEQRSALFVGQVRGEQDQLPALAATTRVLRATIAHEIDGQAVHGLDAGVDAALVKSVGTKQIAAIGEGYRRRTVVHRGLHQVGEPTGRGEQTVFAVRVKVDEGRHVTHCQQMPYGDLPWPRLRRDPVAAP